MYGDQFLEWPVISFKKKIFTMCLHIIDSHWLESFEVRVPSSRENLSSPLLDFWVYPREAILNCWLRVRVSVCVCFVMQVVEFPVFES